VLFIVPGFIPGNIEPKNFHRWYLWRCEAHMKMCSVHML